ncbi:MAG: hypothetical protein QG577_2358, partial [Thermodesulfobacteriota bacterium]|nr:hypothetical protein [Thermodesulfobacteriota bacterium]
DDLRGLILHLLAHDLGGQDLQRLRPKVFPLLSKSDACSS